MVLRQWRSSTGGLLGCLPLPLLLTHQQHQQQAVHSAVLPIAAAAAAQSTGACTATAQTSSRRFRRTRLSSFTCTKHTTACPMAAARPVDVQWRQRKRRRRRRRRGQQEGREGVARRKRTPCSGLLCAAVRHQSRRRLSVSAAAAVAAAVAVVAAVADGEDEVATTDRPGRHTNSRAARYERVSATVAPGNRRVALRGMALRAVDSGVQCSIVAADFRSFVTH